MKKRAVKNIRLLLMVFLSALSVGVVNATDKLATLPSVYIEKNSCPSLSCTCNQWTGRVAAPIYSQPGEGNKIGILKIGEPLRSSRGEVHVVPVKINVIREHKEDVRTFKPGDTIYLLQYLYEGIFKAWCAGDIFELYGIGVAGLGNFVRPPEKNELWAEVNGKYSNERWVEVKTERQLIGWTLEQNLEQPSEFPDDNSVCAGD